MMNNQMNICHLFANEASFHTNNYFALNLLFLIFKHQLLSKQNVTQVVTVVKIKEYALLLLNMNHFSVIVQKHPMVVLIVQIVVVHCLHHVNK